MAASLRKPAGGRHFRRQQVIAGFIVDFYCHSASLIVEVDGEILRKQREADDARDQALLDLGTPGNGIREQNCAETISPMSSNRYSGHVKIHLN
jgi:hypothetical protein